MGNSQCLCPKFTFLFFQNLTSSLAPHLHLPLLVVGDFSSVLDNREDRSAGPCQLTLNTLHVPTPLLHFADRLQLVDLWRLTHPEGKEYTLFPPPHISLFRIDYTFLNSLLLAHATDPCIHDIAISDHEPISVNLLGPVGRDTGKNASITS